MNDWRLFAQAEARGGKFDHPGDAVIAVDGEGAAVLFVENGLEEAREVELGSTRRAEEDL